MRAYEDAAAGRVRRARARPHRGEPAGAHPRQPADGALQQVRLAGPDDRQQVGDVGRLHDPLRRPRRAASRSSRTCPRRSSTACARWRNSPAGAIAARAGAQRRHGAERPIPASIIERAPSAELRHDQRDEDSLPPYELLDRILEGYVELDHSREQLIAQGLPDARRRPHDPPGRPRRVQAPPGAARHQDHRARVRPRPAHADHQPLPRLGRRAGESARRPIAGGRRSARVRLGALSLAALCALALVRLRRHAAEPAHPPQHPRGPDRGAVPRVLAGGLLPGHGRQRSHARPERRLQPSSTATACRGGQGDLRPAAAGGDLARQQLPARRLDAEPLDAHPGGRRRARPGGQDDRDPHRRRRRGHLRHGLAHGRRPPPGRSCRSTRSARPKRRCPRRCRTRASARRRCPRRCPRRCARWVRRVTSAPAQALTRRKYGGLHRPARRARRSSSA